MDYRDYYWGSYRDYHRDPFPHSLLRTRLRQTKGCARKISHVASQLGYVPRDLSANSKLKILRKTAPNLKLITTFSEVETCYLKGQGP